MTRTNRIAVLIVGLFVLGACAEQVGDIDRTQPNKLKKTQFAGVWYSTSTVLEAPMPSAVTFIGEMPFGSTGKIVWDVQEKALIAYPATEMYIEGAEEKWQKRQIRNYWNPDDVDHPFIEVYTGNPVAAFTIESHFDVKRQYNPSTGEQTNVIEENTTDRKWWEREYVRVDWSKNLITDFGFLSGQTNNTALNYYVQEFEADNPDRPTFEPDYMDFVMRYYVEPDSPANCSVYTAEPWDCVGAVVKVRYAFEKVPVNHDYIPWAYTNWDQQDLFGYFLTERYGFNEDFGTTYHSKVSLINRWNIWDRSKADGEDVMVEGPEGPTAKACVYKSDCDEAAGEFCRQDAWYTPGTCVVRTPIPPAQRKTRPILYHLSAEHPPELLQNTYDAIDGWDDVFRDTVAWVQYWDERGLYEMRTCDTNDDCNASALFDDYVGVEEPTPCGADADCGADAFCEGKVCKTKIPCDADNPCYYGQSCSNEGYCEQGSALAASDKVRARAHTAVLVADDAGAKPIYVVDNDYGAKDAAKAAVRLIHAAPGEGAIDLVDEAGNTLIAGVTYDAATRGTTYTMVAPTFSHFYAKAGGAVLAKVTYVDIKAGDNHLFVYGGGDRLVHAQSGWTPQGLRVINAIGPNVEVDVAVNGALRAQKLGYLEATEHLTIGNGDQRLTVVRTGERTDVTCYHYQSKGYCIGWKGADDDEQVRATVRAKKNTMSSMFLACENIYSGDACTEDDAKLAWNSAERVAKLNDCRYAFVNEAGAVDNLCKKWVAQPYQLKKHGDIRYNLLYWIEEEQMASPLGYGPSAAAPDTGEIFYGIAHIYGAPLITYYRYCVDLLELVTGKRTKDDLLSGQFIADYVAARGKGGSQGFGPTDSLVGALAADHAQSKQYTAAEEAVIAQMTHQGTAKDFVAPMPTLNPDIEKLFGHAHDHEHGSIHAPETIARMADPNLLKVLNRQRAVPLGAGLGSQRLARMKGTVLEDILSTNEFKLLLNESDLASGQVASLALDSLLDGDSTPVEQVLNRVVHRDRERLKKLASHNVYASDFLDEALLGTAMHFGCNLPPEVEQPTTDRKHPGLGLADANGGVCPAGQTCTCLEGEDLFWAYGGRYYMGVLQHEVGHTVGLRHNFNASNDVFNLRPEYYQARTRHYVPCRVRDGREGCEAGQVCDPGCAGDGECFAEHRCVSGTCVEAREDGTYPLNELGEVEEWGVCAYQLGSPVVCQTSADCPTGGTCDRNGSCVAKAQKACDGFTTPCAKGQICDAGTCKVQGASGLELPEVVVTSTDKPHRFKAFIPKVGMDASEIAKQRTEYQYSTLMDYGGRINFDIQGLGMYDRAAIKMGYGALRDVYANTSVARTYAKIYAKEIGYPEYTFAFYLNGDFWKYAGGFYSYYHPLFFMNYMVGGPAQNYRRLSVPYYQVKFENAMAKAFNREELDHTYMAVPYHYMGDEYNGNTGTYTWDLGIDMGEITYHMYNNLHDYYAFDAFKRESYGRYRGGATSGYLSRIMDRWLPPMKDAGMSYAFMVQILSRYSDWQTWQYNRMEGWEKVHTAQQSFRYLSNLLASPWPGSFRKETTIEGLDLYRNQSPWMGQAGSELDIPIGDGKFPFTTFWMNDQEGKQMDYGYHFFEHPLFVGAFWEKFGALLALTDSTANFLSDYVGESLSVGVGTSIGFNTVFQDQMTNLLGGIIADDLAQFAGYVEDTVDGPSFRYRDPFDPDAALGRTLVEPSIHNLTLKTLASVFGIIYMPAAFNTNFIDSLAVFLEGSGEEYELYDDETYGVERVTFLDPFGMKTYVAYRPNFGNERVSPAYDLVIKAQAAADAWEAEADDAEKARLAASIKGYVQTLDMLRVLHRTYGTINY